MAEISIQTVDPLSTEVQLEDRFHAMRIDESNVLLSYKTKFNELSACYLMAHDLNESIAKVSDLFTKTVLLSTNYVLKKTIDETYARKDTLENKKPGLLTRSQMDALIAKYATPNDVAEKTGAVKEYAYKLQEEMTDLIGAALIGICQIVPAETPPEDEEETPPGG